MDITMAQKALSALTQEHHKVTKAIEHFSALLRQSSIDAMAIGAILEAMLFAAERHREQRRNHLDEPPYIIHPLEVASYIIEIGGVSDPDILKAALLHDTIEDTDTTAEELTTRFGQVVSDLVLEVSDNKFLPKKERKRQQIITAPYKSRGAAIIKLADKLHNLESIKEGVPLGWSPRRVRDYFSWAARVISGLPRVNPPLEEALRHLFNDKL